MQENKQSKNIFPVVVILIIVLLLIGGAYWYSNQESMFPPVQTENEEQIADTEIKDTEEDTSTSSVSEEEEETTVVTATEEDLEAIKQLFAAKYDKDISEVEIEITEDKTPHVMGSIHFVGEMGGGMFLAYKQDVEWVLVFDGNGTISCESIADYDFPTDMVPECWDETNMVLIKRDEATEETSETPTATE